MLIAVLIIVNAARDKNAQSELKFTFGTDNRFVGKKLHEIVDVVGPYTTFGSMDHGIEAAQWRVGQTVAEAWFEKGTCVGSRTFTITKERAD
jgi:hypothetical protein